MSEITRGGGHFHWPVYMYVMRLSIFCIGLSLNAVLFTNLHPMTSNICFFDQNNFPAKSSNFEKLCKSRTEKISKKMLKLSGFCTISHPMTILFWIWHPMTPFLQEDSPLISCVGVGAPPSFYCVSPTDMYIRDCAVPYGHTSYTENPEWVIWALVCHYTDKKTHFSHIFESFCPCTDPLWFKWFTWVFLCTSFLTAYSFTLWFT